MTSNRQELHDLLKKTVKNVTVLYLDDEKQNLNSFSCNFRRKYNILTARTEKEALDMLKKNEVDVFITDFRMPNINGVEMVKSVQDLYPKIKSMIITAYSDGIKSTVPILDKPFDVVDIVKNINYLCA